MFCSVVNKSSQVSERFQSWICNKGASAREHAFFKNLCFIFPVLHQEQFRVGELVEEGRWKHRTPGKASTAGAVNDKESTKLRWRIIQSFGWKRPLRQHSAAHDRRWDGTGSHEQVKTKAVFLVFGLVRLKLKRIVFGIVLMWA